MKLGLRRAALGLVVLAMVLVGVAAASGQLSSQGEGATTRIGGTVTTSSVGTIPFGASVARVRSWAGVPEFTSPPVKSYPVPRRAKGALVLGYHCEGQRTGGGQSSCHTLFGFLGGKLTAFSTDSSRFHLASGVRPGMQPNEVVRREPESVYKPGCATYLLPARAGDKVAVQIARWTPPRAFSLYVSHGSPAFVAPCS